MATEATHTLLAVFAHPDDEAYSCAGTLARAAAAGARVVLATASRGEAGFDLHTGLAPGPDLADKRSAELAASCKALGIESPRYLDLPDGGLEAVGLQAGAARLTDLLGRTQPSAVIGLGADGVYGHRDHLAVHAWLRAAVRGVPAETRPRLLEVAFPADLFAPVHLRLLGKYPEMIATGPDTGFGTPRDAADLIVDIRPQSAAKRAALAAHRSQTRRSGQFILPGVEAHLLAEEWFCRIDGPALPSAASDPLAGL